MQNVPSARRILDDPHADAWARVLVLVGVGYTRHAAAKASGMNSRTVRLRFERYRAAHGLPPLPDARRGPRGKADRSARASGDSRASA